MTWIAALRLSYKSELLWAFDLAGFSGGVKLLSQLQGSGGVRNLV
jgi:hypothetical protein